MKSAMVAGGPATGAAVARAEVITPEADVVVEAMIAEPMPSEADRRAEARMKGYVGEACGECGNFTLVRNGTCLKCDTCGATSGCS